MKKYLALFFLIFSRLLFSQVEIEKTDSTIDDNAANSIFTDSFSTYELGLSYPLSFKAIKYFKDLYKNFSISPSFSYRYLLGNKHIAFGIGAQIAFYSDIGYTAQTGQRGKAEGSLELSSQRTKLSLLPYQFVFVLHLSPVEDTVVFDIWSGYQELYWEEVRSVEQAEDSISYLNKGWNSHIVLGASIGIRINDLDQESSLSLSNSMNIENIFFTPFYEMDVPLKQKKLIGNRIVSNLDFKHTRVGFKIVFETS